MILSDVQIYAAMRAGGFEDNVFVSPGVSVAEAATAIAKRESGGDPELVNDNPDTGDYSVGLLQINLADPDVAAAMKRNGITEAMLKYPRENAHAGFVLYAGRLSNLNLLWYINRPGPYQARYEAHLPAARAAAQASASA